MLGGGNGGGNVKVYVNGSPLTSKAALHIAEVVVDEDVSVPSMFSIQLLEADDMRQVMTWVDDETLFAIGSQVEIRLGEVGAMKPIMKGEVVGLEPEFSSNRLMTITVRGYDRRHRLQRGRKTRTFLQQKDSEIAAQIATESGLTGDCEDSGVTLDYVIQSNSTDFEFLNQRAARIGYEVVVEDKTLFFRAARNTEAKEVTLTLYKDLLEFSPRLSTLGQAKEVTVRGWDVKKKEVIKSSVDSLKAKMGGAKGGGEIVTDAFGAAALIEVDRAITSQAEADKIARGLYERMSLSLVTGDGLCPGRPDVRAGKVISLQGLGKRFSGLYYVTRAIHTFAADQGYETRFQVRRTAL
jgi:phage protein D